jgi:hypothetical protein
MHIALEGALVGLGIGILLVVTEYMFLKKAVAERATPNNPKPQFDPSDRNRIKSLASFAIFLPPALALGFWLIWG